MLKTWKTLVFSLSMLHLMAGAALAHDYWLIPQAAESNTYTIKMGFGHKLVPEAIPAPVLERINPPSLAHLGGEIPLTSGSDSTEFLTPPLEKGAYIAASSWKPTMWCKGSGEAPVQGSKKDVPDAKMCFLTIRFSKLLIQTGEEDAATFLRPLGHDMEIVPLAVPGIAGKKTELPVQVLLQGVPKEGITITAEYKTPGGEVAKAESYITNKEGKTLIPLAQPGFWLLVARFSQPYPDPTVCDTEYYDASLTFTVPSR